LEAEVHQVQQEVRGSKLRDNIEVHYRPAADLDSLIQGLNDLAPAIIHFSGHGNESGVGTDDAKSARPEGKLVSFELLAKAIAATDKPPQVIVLNSCKSAGAKKSFFPPAKAIVAMGDSIGDLAATGFAAKFYAAIAAGQSFIRRLRRERLLSKQSQSMRQIRLNWFWLKTSIQRKSS
jgi:hypothetical protein